MTKRDIMKKQKQIQTLLDETKSYFGNEEFIYIFKCKRCVKLEPVPSFIVNEEAGFLKFIRKKSFSKTECLYCNGTMASIFKSDS